MQLQQKSKQQQQKKEPRDEGKSICSISDSLMPKYKEPAVRTSSAHTRTPHSLRHLGSETAHPAELPIPFRNYINGFQDIITSTLPTHCCTPAPSLTSLRANWLRQTTLSKARSLAQQPSGYRQRSFPRDRATVKSEQRMRSQFSGI